MHNILFFISNFHQKKLTGQQKIGFGLAKELKKRGHRISIITNSSDYNKAEIIDCDGMKCLIVSGEADIFNFIRHIFKIIRFSKQAKPHIIHGNGLASALLILFLSRLTRTDFVQTIYDIVGFSNFKRNIFCYCLRFSGLVFVSSSYIKRILVEHNVASGKIVLAYYGVESKWFEEIKENTDIENNSLSLLFWGDAKADRGLDVFLELIRDKHKELSKKAKLKYIFAIRYYEKNYKKLLEDIARELPVQVIYDSPDVKEVVRRSDIIVLPYKTTTLQPPLTLIESMLSGKIVITSDVHANSEFIKNGYSGFLLKENNAKELYGILDNILPLTDKTKTVGFNAWKSSFEKYRIENNIENTLKEYSSILKKE